MKCIYIEILLIVLIVIILYSIYNTNEYYDGALSNEGIQNISSVYNTNKFKANRIVADTELISNNKNTLGDTTIENDFTYNKDFQVNGSVNVDGNIKADSLKIGGILLTYDDEVFDNPTWKGIPTLVIQYDNNNYKTYLNKNVHATYKGNSLTQSYISN